MQTFPKRLISGFRSVHFAFALLVAGALPVIAVLPPSAYEQMQREAPEHVEIEVLRVETVPGDDPTEEILKVTAVATKVHRTASGILEKDFLLIVYPVRKQPEGFVGPGTAPRLKEGTKCPAYLKSEEGRASFVPAAGAMSFDDF